MTDRAEYNEWKIPINNSDLIILWTPSNGPMTAAEWNQFTRMLEAMRPALVVDPAGAS